MTLLKPIETLTRSKSLHFDSFEKRESFNCHENFTQRMYCPDERGRGGWY